MSFLEREERVTGRGIYGRFIATAASPSEHAGATMTMPILTLLDGSG
jgi:hypothetical protein